MSCFASFIYIFLFVFRFVFFCLFFSLLFSSSDFNALFLNKNPIFHYTGAMGPAVDNRVAKEVKGKKLDTMKKCRAGVEFHVHVTAAGQSYNSISTFGRFKRNANECCCCCKVEAVV